MSILFGIIAPVFALILMGAVAIWRRWMDSHAVKGMNDFVFFAAMPCLLFRAVVEAPPLRLADVAGSFLAGAVVLFLLFAWLARRVLRLRMAHAGIAALGAVYGNTVMLGVPLVDALYGPEGVANLLAVVAFHSAVLLPLGTVLIEADAGQGRGAWQIVRATAPGLLRNPVVLSILLAFAWRATGLGIAGPADRLMLMLGRAGPPMALFCLGASLPRPRGLTGLGEVGLSSLVKLVVMPAVVAAIAHAVGVTGVAFKVVVLASALPTGANAFLLARRYEVGAEASATTIVVSTILSVATLTALLAWLG